jgi:hypothetical protein
MRFASLAGLYLVTTDTVTQVSDIQEIRIFPSKNLELNCAQMYAGTGHHCRLDYTLYRLRQSFVRVALLQLLRRSGGECRRGVECQHG